MLLFRTQPNALCRYNPYGACGRALLEHHLHVMLHVWTCHTGAPHAHPHRGQTGLRAHTPAAAETPLSPDPPLSRTVRRAARRVHTTAHFDFLCCPRVYCILELQLYLQSGERVSGTLIASMIAYYSLVPSRARVAYSTCSDSTTTYTSVYVSETRHTTVEARAYHMHGLRPSRPVYVSGSA